MVTGDLQPGATVGEYQIERVIGEGSFGKVYAAVHPMIGKQAAIKVLGYEHSQNPQFVSRFLEEARAVNKIRHRNIVDIFSFGKLPDGRNYLVMELLDGKPMGDWLAERGAVPVREALPILRKVARALEAAHKQNIAHRDLKPDNIFFTFDEDGIVFPVLLDFGIAKLMGDSPMGHKTQTGTPMGTPLYMSPEQCKGAQMDHRTDIYSFGIVVFEMLTGRRPFDSDNVMEIMMAHLSQEPPAMSSMLPSLPAALDPPIKKMLEKSPEERPPSITIAIEALIAAAKSVGIAVPSSRDISISGSFGGNVRGSTAPMGFDMPGDTVPETPAEDPRPQVAITKHETTKESYAYPAPPTAHSPGVAPAGTNVDSSLEPVGAPIPPPPKTDRRRKGGGLLYVLGGILVLALVGGGLFATGVIKIKHASDSSESEEDDDEDDGADKPDPEPRKEPGKKKKKDGPANGTEFGNTPLATGDVANTSESLRVAFTLVEGAKKTNISRSQEQKSRFEVLSASESGVSKAKITFQSSEWNESRNHGSPQKFNDRLHGNTYEIERAGSGRNVQKGGGAMDNDERKDVERHAAGLLGNNMFASTLGGKTVAVGQQLDLPFNTAMYLVREYDRTKFPKLNGSMSLQRVVDKHGVRVGVFTISLSVHYKNDNGTLLKSDLSGTVMIQVDDARVQSLELYGPLNMTHPDEVYEPGTWSYSYTTQYGGSF